MRLWLWGSGNENGRAMRRRVISNARAKGRSTAAAQGDTWCRPRTATWMVGELRVRPETLYGITKPSQHEANGSEAQERQRCSVEVLPIFGEPSATVGRVGDWRAGLGRCLCSPLARPFVCECHKISTMPRFQPPPHRTQRANFWHYAHLFASPQSLWDLSCRDSFPRGSTHPIVIE
jgi:hypothetical protein